MADYESKESFVVEAVLRARDAGLAATMAKAAEATGNVERATSSANDQALSFQDTLKGFVGSQLILAGIAKGWGLIRGSIDKALGRIDTLDQFSRSIQLMTGSSEVAAEAVDKVNQSVKGTAYGLDVAASAVQGLVTAGQDVDKAVSSIGLFGDALALFGTASNDALNSVAYSLQKVATQGKANGEVFRELANKGIPAMQIFAEASGQTGEEVSKQLQKGAISAEEFFATMEKGFKMGTASFPALAGAAKEAGASWSASIANAKAAVTRGVQSIITSWEEGRKKADLKSTKTVIANLGSFTEKVLKQIGKLAGFVGKNFRALSGVVLSGLAGIQGHKAWQMISRYLSDHRQKLKDQRKAWDTLFAGLEKGASVSDIYANAMAKSTAEEEKRIAAAKLGLTVTEEGNILKQNGAALTKAETAALVEATSAHKMQLVAKQMGLVVTKEGNIVQKNGLAFTTAQKTALLAETGAITANTLAHGVLAGQISITTAAQIALNTAMKANPIGFIIAGIGLAITALSSLNRWLNKNSKEQEMAAEAAQTLAGSLKSLAAAGEERNQELSKELKGHEKAAQEAKNYAYSLSTLKDQYKEADDRQKAFADTIENLKKLYPEIAVSSKEWAEDAGKCSRNVQDQIQTLEKLSKVEAYKKQLADLKELRTEQEIQLSVAKEKLQELESSGMGKKKIFFGLSTKDSDGVKDLKASIEALDLSLAKTHEQYQATAKALEKYDEQQLKAALSTSQARAHMEELVTTYGRTKEEAEKIARSLGDAGASFGAFTGAAGKLAENLGIAAKDAAGFFDAFGISAAQAAGMTEEELDKMASSISGLAEDMGTTTSTIAQMASNQGASVEELAETYQVSFGTAKDAVSELSEMGLTLGDIAKLSGGDLNKLGESLETLTESMGLSTEEVVRLAKEQGLSISELASTYEDRLAAAESAIEKFSDTADAGFSAIEQKTALSFDEIKSNLEEHAKALEQWRTNVEALMKSGIDQGVIAKLKEMGAEGAEQSQVLVNEIVKANGGAIESNKELSENARALVDDINAEYARLYAIQEKAAETSVNAEHYIQEGRKPIQAFVQGLAAELDDKEPAFKAIWLSIPEKAEEAIKESDFGPAFDHIDGELTTLTKDVGSKQRARQSREISALQKDLEGNTSSAIKTTRDATLPIFDASGKSLTLAFAEGMRSQTGAVAAAAQELSRTAQDSLKLPDFATGAGAKSYGPGPEFDSKMKGLQERLDKIGHSGGGGNAKAQPAKINLNLGGNDYETFVDDIYRQGSHSQRVRGKLGV